MKIIKKALISITIIFIALFSINTVTSKVEAASLSDTLQQAENFLATGEAQYNDPNNPTIDKTKLEEGVNFIYNIFLAAGAFVATVVGIILGIKLMTAATADEKAHYKKILTVYIVGCVVVFGAVGIWRIVIDTINGVTPDGVAQPTTQTSSTTQSTQPTQPAKSTTGGQQSTQPTQPETKKLQQDYNNKLEEKALEIAKRNGAQPKKDSGATSVPESALIDTEPYKKQAEEELLKEFLNDLTEEQEKQIQERALQIKNMGKENKFSSGTSSLNSEKVSRLDPSYTEAAKQIMMGK